MNRLFQAVSLVLVLPQLCAATTQICDRLIYDGNEYSGDYDEFPLEDYWSEERPKPDLLPMGSTACYRGYIATWEVRNESLFLKSLSREDDLNDGEKPIPLQSVFPDTNSPVLANWFSGVLEYNRGADYNERLFISFYKGRVLGIRKATKEQLRNPSSEDLTWSSLLVQNKAADTHRVKKWRFWRSRWIDGEGMFEWDSPVRSGESFKLRGIYFPDGKLWTAPVGFHFLVEATGSAKLPAIVTPVEITARSKHRQINWHHLAVSRVEVLPVRSVIQGGNYSEILIGQLIVVTIVGMFVARFGIAAFARKEDVSVWKCAFAASYRRGKMHSYVREPFVSPFLIVGWLFLLSLAAFVIYLGALHLVDRVR